MPKKGRKVNVRQQVRQSGQRAVEFQQGQRRVSTPRGRNTTLTLAPRVQQSATDRLSIYATQSAQQVAQAQQRERMTAFYQENMDRQEAVRLAQRQEAERQQAVKLQRQESARARRDRARAEVRDIRGRQAQQQAEERRQMGERLGRAQSRVEANRQRRQQRDLAQAQLQQQQATAQQQLQQQQAIAQQQLQQQREIAGQQRESKERIAYDQLALQREGMGRQDRLIQEHFTQMRGMMLNAQAGQERRIGELENTMRAGIRAIQDRTGQDKVDITYLNDATGRQLDHAGVKPPPQRLTLQRADTTDSEASELARQITGIDTGRHRPSQFSRSPTAPLPTTSTEFREARAGLKKVLTGDDIGALARAYNSELEKEKGSTRRRRAVAIDRRLQFLQDDPTPSPEQLARRRAFLQEPEPEQDLRRVSSTASTLPYVDSSDEDIRPPTPRPDLPDGSYSTEQGSKLIRHRQKYDPRPPEPEPSFTLTPASPQGRAVSPTRGARSTTPPNKSRSPPQSTLGGMAVEGLSSGLRTGAGVIGGLATGLGEAVYESLPSARDIGKATGEAVISGGATALQTARGLVSDVVSSTDEDEEGLSGEGLLENTNPLEELGGGKYATGSDKRGWESKLGFTITDTTGSINKKKKGAEYFLMKKDAKPTGNYQIVDKTNPKLTKWRNVRIPKLNDLIREGKVSVS